MASKKETVLLYVPQGSKVAQKIKVAMIRMGVRIQMVTEDSTYLTIGELLGITQEEGTMGFRNIGNDISMKDHKEEETESEQNESVEEVVMDQEVLVMYQFTSPRIDVLIRELRKAGVPKINLKAVVTEQNSTWSFRKLTGELKKEHTAFTQ